MLKLQCFIGWVVQQFVSVFVSTIYIIYRFETPHLWYKVTTVFISYLKKNQLILF